MAGNIQKEILIDVRLKADQLKADVISANSTLDALLVSSFKLKAAGQQNTTEFITLASEIRNTKTAIREANKDIDNTSKALNAATGSINQNKALVSLITREYDKLSTSQGKTAASTVAMGNRLKEVTEVLNKQRQAVGNNTSNIGNYTQSILAAIPGMGKYSTMITNATRAFNLMGNGSKAAAAALGETAEGAEVTEGAVGSLGAMALGLSAALAGVAVAGASVIAYFKDVATFSDALSNSWAGLKAGFTALFQGIGRGDFKNLMADMENASKQAHYLNQEMINLNRDLLVSSVQTNAENQFIATQMLKMRNLHTTLKEAQQIFKEVQETAEEQFRRVSSQAESGYNIVANKIKLTANLTRDELRTLAKEGVSAAEEFKKEGKHISDDLLVEFAQFQNMRISAGGLKDQIEQRAQNREDQKLAKNEKAAAAALSKEQQERDELAKIKAETEQLNSERLESLSKTLDIEQEAFARDLSKSDEYYRQKLFKIKEFIDKQQVIVDSLKSTPTEKSAARGAIGVANQTGATITEEKSVAQLKLLEDHDKAIKSETEKAANDLAALQISSILDAQEREKQSENLSYKEKIQALYKERDAIIENERDLQKELNDKANPPTKERTVILQKELDFQKTLYDINADKTTETTEQQQKKLTDIVKKYTFQRQELTDQTNIIKNREKPTDSVLKSTKPEEDAEKKLVDDRYEYEKNKRLEELAGQTKDQIANDALLLNLKANHEKDITDLTLKFNEDRAAKILAIEKAVQTAAFTIVSNNIKSEAQAIDVRLKRSQESELANTSLTSAQKLAVNNKYRILEGQQKVKEFRANQKLQIAQAIADGALAMIKTTANTGLPLSLVFNPIVLAETALAVGTIAAQKPPAFATGGYYKSDGRGTVLKGPGTSTSDSINARLSNGESIINAKSTSMFAGLLSSINQIGGGAAFSFPNMTKKYAVGGIISDGNNSNRYYAQPQEGTQNLANQVAFSLINNFPPIITDVKDVHNQLGILVNTQDRVRI